MASSPCTIRHITLIEVANGVRYTGKIDKDGMASEETQGETDFGPSLRKYFCSNCMKYFDGSETFDEVKAHLGTFPLTD